MTSPLFRSVPMRIIIKLTTNACLVLCLFRGAKHGHNRLFHAMEHSQIIHADTLIYLIYFILCLSISIIYLNIIVNPSRIFYISCSCMVGLSPLYYMHWILRWTSCFSYSGWILDIYIYNRHRHPLFFRILLLGLFDYKNHS